MPLLYKKTANVNAMQAAWNKRLTLDKTRNGAEIHDVDAAAVSIISAHGLRWRFSGE